MSVIVNETRHQVIVNQGGSVSVVSVGTQGPPGPQGIQGIQGEQAYNNYTGTPKLAGYIAKGPRFDFRALEPTGDGITDETALLQSALDFCATNKIAKLYVPRVAIVPQTQAVYRVGNVNVPSGVSIDGEGILLVDNISHNCITLNSNCDLLEITLKGTGTFDTTNATGEPPALVRISNARNVNILRAKFIDAPSCSVLVFKSVNVKIIGNNFDSVYAGGIETVNLFHIALNIASDVIISGNTINGAIEGVCGGGDDDDIANGIVGLDGVTSAKCRNVQVLKNFVNGQLDHAVYFSDYCEGINISANNQLTSVNEPIKVEGNDIFIGFNRGKGRNGIVGRNVSDIKVIGNEIYTTGETTSTYGLLFSDTMFKRPIKNVKIIGNTFKHLGTISAAGIMVQGMVWDSYQSVISDVHVSDNAISGYGNKSEGAGIIIDQRLFAGDPVTGVAGSNIKIHDNTINMADSTQATYGIFMIYGLTKCDVSHNTISNFTNMGVRTRGVSNSIFKDNTLTASTALGTRYGLFEVAKTPAVQLDSVNNTYDGNKCYNLTAPEVTFVDETSRKLNKTTVIIATASASYTIEPYRGYGMAVYTNPSANAIVTLSNLAGTPWTLNDDITIVNKHASNSITVNGIAVAAGTSARFLNTGSNTFIKVA